MYSERLTAGFEWASRLHATQPRKGVDTPYLSHLLGVASLAIEYDGDEDDLIAAMLHDAVEDCGGLPMLEKIRTKFGNTVASTVEQCSDSVTVAADAKSSGWTASAPTSLRSLAKASAPGSSPPVTSCTTPQQSSMTIGWAGGPTATSAALVPEWRRTLMSTLGMFDVDGDDDMTPATFFPDWDGD